MSLKAKVMVHVVLLVMALAMQVLGVTLLATGYTGGHDTVAFCTWFVLTMIEPIVFVLALEVPDAGGGGAGRGMHVMEGGGR
ncbi:hypothetical protein [Pseudoscardovia suis]|uniref:Uncharacterized protein n=1 Tax=Pseudoscardovia suis TaxID=987063 RepID=A0A261F0Z5_9BIFI|nr:hypothetical protein [Pseudoscardovia suis]OZG52792.1 hypothetical protein PSSU_0410 [Pseudoscardovia suis]PJJ64967.1 hypothetical protein CLV65_1519 [Pseudoscardovia suis]